MIEGVFSQLSKPLKKEIKSLEWNQVSKIQEMAIPEILEDNNALIIVPQG